MSLKYGVICQGKVNIYGTSNQVAQRVTVNLYSFSICCPKYKTEGEKFHFTVDKLSNNFCQLDDMSNFVWLLSNGEDSIMKPFQFMANYSYAEFASFLPFPSKLLLLYYVLFIHTG